MVSRASDAANRHDFNVLLQFTHDQAVREGTYRPKREDESLFWWWQAYQHDVLGEDTQGLSGAWAHAR